jgi:hypothetical protein
LPGVDDIRISPPSRAIASRTRSRPTAAAGQLVGLVARRHAGIEQRRHHVVVGGQRGPGRGPSAALDQALAQLLDVDAAAVVGDLDHHQVALGARRDLDRRRRRSCRASTRSAGGSMPWATALRRIWISGSVIFSATALSNSVSSPRVRSSTLTPAPAPPRAGPARAGRTARARSACGPG